MNSNFIKLGINKENSELLNKKIFLSNIFSLIFILVSLPFVFIFWYLSGIALASSVMFFIVLFAATIYFNKLRHYLFARINCLCVGNLALLFYSLSLGTDFGVHFIFIAFTAGPSLLFLKEEQLVSWSIITISIVLFYMIIALEGFALTPIQIFNTNFIDHSQIIIFSAMTFVAFAMIQGVVRTFQGITQNYERKQHEIITQLNHFKEKTNQDLALAKSLQLNILPKKDLTIGHYHIQHFYQAARIVGGDYVDYSKVSDTQVIVIIADIVGKGISASLMLQALKTEMDTCFRTSETIPSPSELLSDLNVLFQNHVTIQRHVPMIYGILDTDKNTFRYTNAGHEPAVILTSVGSLTELTPQGAPLAFNLLKNNKRVVYEESIISLNKGDKLILFTDGFTDMVNNNGDRFDYLQFQGVLKHACMKKDGAFIQDVVGVCNRYQDVSNQADDMTLVMVECDD